MAVNTATYNFKKIPIVPNGKSFIDIILSKTQRKTPTVIHKGYKISRIRQFYMRKVKFTQTTIEERITELLDNFPRLENIHPFYADLMNVLYDRDHYKVALGQMNIVRRKVEQLSSDYVKFIKYGDSLYQCKQLKRAGMGRMVTCCKKLSGALGYLEQVRQHLSRLPTIDPNTRTLLITGFPNVGKSSFINKITRADVDVQPYAFTTKSLYVGHTDYKYMRWQVIDTPGILDHPLEERNTIEMQAVTALAHLKACVLYFMDLSGGCGFSIDAQVSLFNNIKPLFTDKPLVVVINKTDLMRLEDVSEEDRASIKKMIESSKDIQMIQISCLHDEAVVDLKSKACDMLLNYRLSNKMRKKSYDNMQNRIYVAEPSARDTKDRPAFIPESVVRAKAENRLHNDAIRKQRKEDKRTMDIFLEYQNASALDNLDLREKWDLENPSWKYDVIPELIDGRNVADWIDPDIDRRLQELEEEEDDRLIEEAQEQASVEKGQFQMDATSKELVHAIRDKIKVMKLESILKRSRSHKSSKTVPMKEAVGRFQERVGRGRKRSRSEPEAEADSRVTSASRMSARSASLKRARKETPMPGQRGGLRSMSQVERTRRLAGQSIRERNKGGPKGEGDRHIDDMKPKHLFSGKRSNGKTDRR